jgi:hypothetical protein
VEAQVVAWKLATTTGCLPRPGGLRDQPWDTYLAFQVLAAMFGEMNRAMQFL